MSRDQLGSLVHMANQIALNLEPGPGGDAEAAERVANHLRRFWSRGMKAMIQDYARTDGEDLRPVALAAVKLL